MPPTTSFSTSNELIEAHILHYLVARDFKDVAALAKTHFHRDAGHKSRRVKYGLEELMAPAMLRASIGAVDDGDSESDRGAIAAKEKKKKEKREKRSRTRENSPPPPPPEAQKSPKKRKVKVPAPAAPAAPVASVDATFTESQPIMNRFIHAAKTSPLDMDNLYIRSEKIIGIIGT